MGDIDKKAHELILILEDLDYEAYIHYKHLNLHQKAYNDFVKKLNSFLEEKDKEIASLKKLLRIED